MTRQQIVSITRERLDRWAERLAGEHATPAVLVGVGHDHREGNLVLCVTEDGPSEAEIAAFLRWAARQLDGDTPVIDRR